MFKVVIVGTRGEQVSHLRDRLPKQIRIISYELSRVFGLRGSNADLVLCTQFTSHKHRWNLESVLECPVVFCRGGIDRWSAAIAERFDRNAEQQGVGLAVST